METLIKEFTQDCQGCTTSLQVGKRIHEALCDLYGATKAPLRKRLAQLAATLAGSVCRNLGITPNTNQHPTQRP